MLGAVAGAVPDHLRGSRSPAAVAAVVAEQSRAIADPAQLLTGPDRRRPHPPRSAEGHAVSANERCRMVPAVDGWIAVQLARGTDVESVPALVGSSPGEGWAAIAHFASVTPAEAVVARARLLEIPCARLGEITTDRPAVSVRPVPVDRTRADPGVVVDLSAMWAGPLLAHLVGDRISRPVVDVESIDRPDPIRASGDSLGRFLHGGRTLVEVDFGRDRSQLEAILSDARVVVSSGRRRALTSLALDPTEWVSRSGGVWAHVSGYGLEGALCEAPAFGDDAAVAGALVTSDDAGPLFVADAAADPLSGMIGAIVVNRAVEVGLPCVIDVSMAGCAALLAGNGPDRPAVVSS